MTTVRKLAALGLALALGAGCASTSVTDNQVDYSGRLPRPDHIWVYDFGASPQDVPPQSALAAQIDAAQMPTATELAEGRELGAQIAAAIVEKIQALGLPAERGGPSTRPQVDDIEIRGFFASIHQGSAAERIVVGFGAGASKLMTVVEGYEVTPQGLRRLGSGEVDAGGGKGPGAAVPAAIALATANPIGLVVTTAVKAEGEMSGRSTVEGRARQTAQQIVDRLEVRFRDQGWIE